MIKNKLKSAKFIPAICLLGAFTTMNATSDELSKENRILLYETKNLIAQGGDENLAMLRAFIGSIEQFKALRAECAKAKKIVILKGNKKMLLNNQNVKISSARISEIYNPEAVSEFVYSFFETSNYDFLVRRARAEEDEYVVVFEIGVMNNVFLVVDNEHGFVQRITRKGKPIGPRFEAKGNTLLKLSK